MAVLRPSGVSVLASYIVFNVLSITAVILRFYAIKIRGRAVKLHDYFCVLALLCSIAYSIDTLIGTVDGEFGLHIEKALENPANYTFTMKTFFASEWFWATGVCSFRVSMLLLYLDIFPQKHFRWCAYGGIGVVCAFWVGSALTILLSCQPIKKNWLPEVEGTCIDIGTAELAAAAINMILDIVIVAMPLPLVWALQMSKEKKIGVTMTFTLGLGIAGINLARIIKVVDCDLTDFTYCTRDSAILTVAETAMGVVVACVPVLGPIIFRKSSGPVSRMKNVVRGWHENSGESAERVRQGSEKDSDQEAKSLDDDFLLRATSMRSQAIAKYSGDTEQGPPTGGVGVRQEFEVTSHSVYQ